MKPVYLVTGFMRCGTSMMMGSLRAGGLEACFAPGRDKMVEACSDEHYSPNKGGLFELTRREYQDPQFPRGYEGKLVKALSGLLAKMRVMPGGYRVVLCTRDPEEVRQSYVGFFGPRNEIPTEAIENAFSLAREVLANRRDCRWIEAPYRDTVADPLTQYRRISTALDLPIDYEQAAAVVDPKLCHFRREELTIGV